MQDFGGPVTKQYKNNNNDIQTSKMNNKRDQLQDTQLAVIPIWQEVNLKPFRKNFYVPHNNIKNRSEGEVDRYRELKEIIVRGSNVPYPNLCFEEGSFPDYVMEVLIKQGINMTLT